VIKFPYERARAEQAVLWLLHRHGGAMDVLKLTKLLFLADREHLAHYGRPIMGGQYSAMPYGPVPSVFYDEVNRKKQPVSGLFKRERDGDRVSALAPVNEDYLSESDIEVLKHIDQTFGGWDPFRLRDFTHQLRAWRENFKEGSGKRSFPIPYEDFFLDLNTEDQKLLAVIHEDAEARAALE